VVGWEKRTEMRTGTWICRESVRSWPIVRANCHVLSQKEKVAERKTDSRLLGKSASSWEKTNARWSDSPVSSSDLSNVTCSQYTGVVEKIMSSRFEGRKRKTTRRRTSENRAMITIEERKHQRECERLSWKAAIPP